MRASELMQRYRNGDRHFHSLDIRGQNFKGQDLKDADFSHCDIRGTDFSYADLTGAKFIGARAGPSAEYIMEVLGILHVLGLSFASGVQLTVSGYIIATALISRFYPEDPASTVNTGIYLAVILCVTLFFAVRLLEKRVKKYIASLGLGLATVAALLFFLSGLLFPIGVLLYALAAEIQAILIGVASVGAFGGIELGTLAASVCMKKQKAPMFVILVLLGILAGIAAVYAFLYFPSFLLYACVAVGYGPIVNYPSNEALAFLFSFSVSFAILLSLLIISGRFIKLVVTSFLGANLTSVNFSNAHLAKVTFDKAKLVGTQWQEAEGLSRSNYQYLSQSCKQGNVE
ncbi:MAG: pentapeptide repeat-containing protein [Leptolyngbyaceae cyanobacterium]